MYRFILLIISLLALPVLGLRAEVNSLGLKTHHLDFSLDIKGETLRFHNNGLLKTVELNQCGKKQARKIVRSLLPQFAQWLQENSKAEQEDNAQLRMGERVVPVYLSKNLDSSWARMPASVGAHVAALEAKCSKEK